VAKKRIVIKRPRWAKEDPQAARSYHGKNTRWEVLDLLIPLTEVQLKKAKKQQEKEEKEKEKKAQQIANSVNNKVVKVEANKQVPSPKQAMPKPSNLMLKENKKNTIKDSSKQNKSTSPSTLASQRSSPKSDLKSKVRATSKETQPQSQSSASHKKAKTVKIIKLKKKKSVKTAIQHEKSQTAPNAKPSPNKVANTENMRRK
jgi:hypothetical protein